MNVRDVFELLKNVTHELVPSWVGFLLSADNLIEDAPLKDIITQINTE